MSDPARDDSCLSYGEINRELDALTGKTDQASLDRHAELIDMLLTMDMGMGPARRAMGQRQNPVDPSRPEANRDEPDPEIGTPAMPSDNEELKPSGQPDSPKPEDRLSPDQRGTG